MDTWSTAMHGAEQVGADGMLPDAAAPRAHRVGRHGSRARREEPPQSGSARRSLLSVDEAAQYLGISSGTMRNWLSMRRIEHVKVGRLTRISQAVLDRYVAVHTVRAETDQ